MRRPPCSAVSAASLALVASLLSGLAPAKIAESTAYTKAQSFNAALRYLRVDSNYAVTEKDAELGYLMFEYPTGQGQQTTPASIEVVERDDKVLLIVQIQKLPSYHESLLVRALVNKLKADYGEPPARRAPPPEESPKEDPSGGEKKPPASKEDAPSS